MYECWFLVIVIQPGVRWRNLNTCFDRDCRNTGLCAVLVAWIIYTTESRPLTRPTTTAYCQVIVDFLHTTRSSFHLPDCRDAIHVQQYLLFCWCSVVSPFDEVCSWKESSKREYTIMLLGNSVVTDFRSDWLAPTTILQRTTTTILLHYSSSTKNVSLASRLKFSFFCRHHWAQATIDINNDYYPMALNRMWHPTLTTTCTVSLVKFLSC